MGSCSGACVFCWKPSIWGDAAALTGAPTQLDTRWPGRRSCGLRVP